MPQGRRERDPPTPNCPFFSFIYCQSNPEEWYEFVHHKSHDEKLKTKSSPRPCGEEQMARCSSLTNQTRKEHRSFPNELCTHARTQSRGHNRPQTPKPRAPAAQRQHASTARDGGIGQRTHLDDDERSELPLPGPAPGTIQMERRPSR